MKISALAFTFAATVIAFGQTPAATKQALRDAYDNLADSYNRKDADAVMTWLSPDFKWTLLDGKVLKRDDAKAAIQDQFSSTQDGHWHIDLLNTMMAGPMATVIAQYRFDGMLLDPAKKPYKATFLATDRQNWLKGPSGWRQLSDEMLTQSTYAGGLKTLPNVNSGQSGPSSGK